MEKLFAVYLGGNAKGATLETHDIAFAIGTDIKSTFPQLREAWYGIPESIHIDSWTELTHVDGYKVGLTNALSATTDKKLFFINIGSYAANRFGEIHHFLFMVGASAQDVKARAKNLIAERQENFPHADNLIEVDTVREIATVRGLHVDLQKDDAHHDLKITNVYWPLSKDKPVHG